MGRAEGGPRHALAIGTMLHGYVLESVLGHGGFGIVYRARHEELGSTVALKEYFPVELAVREGGSVHPRSMECTEQYWDCLQRFLAEAKLLTQFRDVPGVVSCIDFFRDNGTAYLVMDHVDGVSLAELLCQREESGTPLGENDLRSIAVPLLEALDCVHEGGTLHRDIKPSNILIRRDDGQPVLIDFGAAKHSVALYSKSFAPYTEGYAAIEQVGDGELGPWTDIYAIGAVLWRIVAGGNPPWKPPNPVKVENRLIAEAQGKPSPMPSAIEIGNERFEEGLLKQIDKCLEIPELARPQSCKPLLGVLSNPSIVVRKGTSSPEKKRDGPPRSDDIYFTKSSTTRRFISHLFEILYSSALIVPVSLGAFLSCMIVFGIVEYVVAKIFTISIDKVDSFISPIAWSTLAIFLILFAVYSLRKILNDPTIVSEFNDAIRWWWLMLTFFGGIFVALFRLERTSSEWETPEIFCLIFCISGLFFFLYSWLRHRFI